MRGVLLDPEQRARLVEAGRAAAAERRIERTVGAAERELLGALSGVA